MTLEELIAWCDDHGVSMTTPIKIHMTIGGKDFNGSADCLALVSEDFADDAAYSEAALVISQNQLASDRG